MAQDIYIGVDGGGTKTKMRVEDADGNLLGEARGGPAQIRVSIKQAWTSIQTLFHEILAKNHINPQDPAYRFHAGLALAGTENGKQYDDFLLHPHPFTTLCLKSDGYAACCGAHNGRDGAIIIIGTGTKGFQIEKGCESEVSGWGFPQGDEGGGAWLGLEAVRLTLHSVDGRLPKSALFDAVLAHFNHNTLELLDWTVDATSTKFATLAPIVIQHIESQDRFALKIIQEAAYNIDQIGEALKAKQQDQSKIIPCTLFGGIAPFILPWLNESLRSRIVQRQFSATQGAIFMLKNYMKQKGITP